MGHLAGGQDCFKGPGGYRELWRLPEVGFQVWEERERGEQRRDPYAHATIHISHTYHVCTNAHITHPMRARTHTQPPAPSPDQIQMPVGASAAKTPALPKALASGPSRLPKWKSQVADKKGIWPNYRGHPGHGLTSPACPFSLPIHFPVCPASPAKPFPGHGVHLASITWQDHGL